VWIGEPYENEDLMMIATVRRGSQLLSLPELRHFCDMLDPGRNTYHTMGLLGVLVKINVQQIQRLGGIFP
jgi:hypothetical protein